jgi:hypothetical protein
MEEEEFEDRREEEFLWNVAAASRRCENEGRKRCLKDSRRGDA